MYKNKKILAFTGSLIAVAIPVATVVSCGSASNEWKYNKDERLFEGGPTLGSFQKDIDKIDSSDTKTWKTVERQATFFYYQQEQKGSLNVQKDNFLWEMKKKQDEKDALVDNDNNKKAREALQKDIDNIDKKIKEVEKQINDNTKNTLDYSSSTFSTDYPEILLPESIIKDKQTEIYNNEKNAFIGNYSTRKEGEAAWVTEISKKYDGANSDTEAIDNLVFKVIKTNAFLRNNIKIDTSFTVKQLKWANTAGDNGGKDKDAFPFLKIDGYNGTSGVKQAIIDAKNSGKDPSLRVSGDDDNDKVYFYESNSKIWGHKNEENLKIINEDKLQEIIGIKSIYRMYRHILLNIKPNSKGRTLPWETSIDEIKKLIALQPNQIDAENNPKYQFERIADLWKGGAVAGGVDMNNFDDLVDPETSSFLQQVSDNSPSTKNIGGSLGIHKASYFSNAMSDGFALGALLLEKNETKSAPDKLDQNDFIYEELSKAIERAKDRIFELSGNKTQFTTNTQQNQFIDLQDPEVVKNIFGEEIRNLFDPNALTSIGYKYGTNSVHEIEKGEIGRSIIYTDFPKTKEARFAFISTEDKYGIHLVKRYVLDGSTLGTKAIEQLTKMAKDESIEDDPFKITDLIKPLLEESKLIKNLISDTTTGEGQKFKTYITNKITDQEIKLSDMTNINDADQLITSALDYIENQDVIKANKVASQITNAHSEYLKKALDNKEIAYKSYAPSKPKMSTLNPKEILLPEEIYKIAYELAKKESGA